jgi:hypothetical protein
VSERIEVEVRVCGSCASLEIHPNGLCVKCGYCLGSGDRESATPAPGTRTAALLRLAEAAVRRKKVHPIWDDLEAADDAFDEALAAALAFDREVG